MEQKQTFLRSFRNAFRGLFFAFSNHRNIQIMLAVAFITIIAGYYFKIERIEWAVILLCITIVIGLELINTAIEEILDHLHPDFHEKVGIAKDIAAGAVLFASIGSVITGLCIFAHHLKII